MEDRVANLEKEVQDLKEQLKKTNERIDMLKQKTLEILDLLENHVKGKWTLDEIQNALTQINQLVSLLESAGILNQGDGQGWLAKLIAQQYFAQKQPAQEEVEVRKMPKSKQKKIKQIFEDDEEEENEEEE